MNKFSDSLSADDSDTTSSLDEALAQKDAIAEQRRLAEEAAARIEEFLGAFTGLPESLNQLGGRIDNLVLELLRMAGDAAGRGQELLDAVSELGDSLGRLCECVGGGPPPPDDPDESEPDGSRDGALFRRASFDRAASLDGAAPVDGVGLDGVGFDGSQGGGQFTLASFAGASPFGGAGLDGLDRGLADAGGRVQDLSAGFMELTQAASGFEAQGGSLVELLVRSNALLGEQSGLLGQLSAQAPVLGGELAALFEQGAEAGRVFGQVADAVGASLLDAFEGAIERGESLSDVLKGLALDMAEIALKAAGNALLESILGGLLGGLGGGIGGFAKGAAFAHDGVMARNLKEFARGGIVDTPEAFAFAHGLGIMGEAGPEAILPLARARSGELGVRAMIGGRPAAGGSGGPAAIHRFSNDAPGAPALPPPAPAYAEAPALAMAA